MDTTVEYKYVCKYNIVTHEGLLFGKFKESYWKRDIFVHAVVKSNLLKSCMCLKSKMGSCDTFDQIKPK